MSRMNQALGWGCAFSFAVASGQVPLTHHVGPHDNSLFGHATDMVGDVDADGVSDYVVAGFRHNIDPWNQPGSVTMYSGASADPIFLVHGQGLSWFGFALSAVGDVNGDGVPDFVVGATEQELWNNSTGYARIHSGLDGAILLTVAGSDLAAQFGCAVDDVGDMDNDGVVDVVAGARFANAGGHAKSGRVRVFSGATGSTIHEFVGNAPDQWLGWGLAGTGDTNVDGAPDVVIGAPGADTAVFAKAGKAWLFSGFNGSVLKEFNGAGSNDAFGMYAGGPFDYDGDGAPDVVISAPNDDSTGVHTGSVRIYSGITYAPLLTLRGDDDFAGYGRAIARVGDHDGDGRADLAIGSPYDDFAATTAGSVRIHAAGSGALLRTYWGSDVNDNYGSAVAGGFDLNGDGRDEILIGAEQTIQLDGYLDVQSGDCGSSQEVGVGCPGTGGFTPALAVDGCFTPTGTVILSVDGALGTDGIGPGNFSVLFVGSGSTSIPLGGGCSFYLSGSIPWGITIPLVGDGAGAGTAKLEAVLPSTALGPWNVTLQVFCADAGAILGYTTTNAAVLTAN